MASLEIDANKEHEQLRETHQQRLEATFLDRRLKTEQAYAETLKDANPKVRLQWYHKDQVLAPK